MHRRKTIAASYRRTTSNKKRALAKASVFDDAWATISYVHGTGYTFLALFADQASAESVASLATRQALDDACYGRAPYTIIFSAPVAKDVGCHLYGRPYFATIRNRHSCNNLPMSVALWDSLADAENDHDSVFCLGGPVQLQPPHRLDDDDAPSEPLPIN